MGCLVAKRDIAQRWGTGVPRTHQNWVTRMEFCKAMEREISKVHGCMKKIEQIWGGWDGNEG